METCTARGTVQQAQEVNNTLSFGLAGESNSGYGRLIGQGGRERGQKADHS